MPDPLADFRQAARKFEREMAKAMGAALRDGAELVLDEMRQLTAATGNTLEDLAKMGHPYAWRNKGKEPFADWIVHHQEGDLQGGLARGRLAGGSSRVEIEIHSGADHTWYLLLGTRYMRPRDFVTAALFYQEDRVAELLQQAHARVHDVPGRTPGFRPHIMPILHSVNPAELPERG